MRTPSWKVGNKWVAYGLGNLTARFADGSPEDRQDSVVPRFTFRRTGDRNWEVDKVEIFPAFMEYDPRERVINVDAAIDDPSVSPRRRADYTRIRERIVGYVTMMGADTYGLTLTR